MKYEDIGKDLEARYVKRFSGTQRDDWQECIINEVFARCALEGLVRETVVCGIPVVYGVPSSDRPFVRDGDFLYSTAEANLFVDFIERQRSGGIASDNSALLFPKTVTDERVRDLIGLHEEVEKKTSDHALSCYIEASAFYAIRDDSLTEVFFDYMFWERWTDPEATFEPAISGITSRMIGTHEEKFRTFYDALKEKYGDVRDACKNLGWTFQGS